MLQRCNPQMVEKTYVEARSWRKAAQTLNEYYGVRLSHTTWRDYALGKHDIAAPETRTCLMLPPRACPACGHKHIAHKRVKQKRIREFGYPIEKGKLLLEIVDLHHAPR